MPNARKRAPRPRKKGQPLGRGAWLDAARQALIEEGTAGVEVNKLARRLGATRGGFYWFFESRDELLRDLLSYWADNGIAVFERLLNGARTNGMEEFQSLVHLWVDEVAYDPRWDGAVRDWARTSPAVLKTVQALDEERVALIERMFIDMGFEGTEAHVRARVTYYHQVGYYALGVRESRKQRLELLPYYAKVLTGRDVT